MGMMPKVSIIIPVFNGENFLMQAVNSALNQTHKNIEIIVINDGSTDNGKTEEIALSFGDSIRYFKKQNGGVASALNMGIELMTGEFFSWLSHDDLYKAEKIEAQMTKILTLPKADRHQSIIYCDFEIFFSDKERIFPIILNSIPNEIFRVWLSQESKLHGCTLLIPKSAFQNVGNFNESLITAQDYDLWFRMAKEYKFVHLPQSLIKTRSHANQKSVSSSKEAIKECNNLFTLFVKQLTRDELLYLPPHTLSVAYARLASCMWYRGFLKAGLFSTKLSLSSILKASLRNKFLTLTILVFSPVIYVGLTLSRKLIKPYFRQLIKNRHKLTSS